jgi:hypothetical protein
MLNHRKLRTTTFALAAGVLSTSCSGDDGGGSGGTAADRALAQRNCYLGLQVPGVSHTGYACSGGDLTSSVSGLRPNSFEAALSVSLTLAERPAIGELALASMTIAIPQEGADYYWRAQIDSCLAVATDSALESDFGWVYYRIDVSCTEPALPDDANPGEPLGLGDFTIVAFFSAD